MTSSSGPFRANRQRRTLIRLCETDDHDWITLRDRRYYYLGTERLYTEDALILLLGVCANQIGLMDTLHQKLPKDDYSLIQEMYLDNKWDRDVTDFESYLKGLLLAREPPALDLHFSFETMHRAVLTTDLSDRSLMASIPLMFGYIWLPSFGRLIRANIPQKSPLSQWEIVTDLRASKPNDSAIATGRQKELQWAFNEHQIQMEADFRYREVVSTRRLR